MRHMQVHKWRRWRAKGNESRVGGDVFARAEQEVTSTLQRVLWSDARRVRVDQLEQPINVLLSQTERFHDEQTGSSEQAVVWLAALIMQAPRAVLAQRQMDAHPHGYSNKQARLYELIAFNDTYVSAILSLPEQYHPQCNDRIKQVMDQFCRRVKVPCLTNEQWEAITHGLSREIAVYHGALALGYRARMTSRREDAMGVDMVVTDEQTGMNINLDIKTRSSFHYRLQDLHNEGRITELQREEADQFGHITVRNGHGSESVVTTILRIDEETYGRVIDFTLERLEPLKTAIEQIANQIQRVAA